MVRRRIAQRSNGVCREKSPRIVFDRNDRLLPEYLRYGARRSSGMVMVVGVCRVGMV